MPGIDQLKRFENDIGPIGNEPDIRKNSGTTMPEVGMPEKLPAGDDSYDFEFALPLQEGAKGGKTDPDADALTEESFDSAAETGTLPQEPLISSMEDLDPDIAAFLASSASSSVPPSFEDVSEQEFLQSAAETGSSSDFSSNTGDLSEQFPAADVQASSSVQEGVSSGDVLDSGAQKIDSVSQTEPLVPSSDEFEFDAFDDFNTEPLSSLADTAVSETETSAPRSSEDVPFSSSDMLDSSDVFSDSPEEFNLNTDLSEELNEGFIHTPDVSENDIESAAEDFSLGTDFDFSEKTSDTQPVLEEDFPQEETGESTASLGVEDTDIDNFEIPGFSDTVTASAPKGIYSGVKKRDSKLEQDFDRTYLNDEEYKIFHKNLYSYPLNVRIAVEQLIVKNEFTDAAVMEVLFKVIKKVSARHLASHLGKMLDIPISVPLNYERRSAEQYEIYKTSLEYQLKNRIIPCAAIALVLGALLYVLSFFGYTFVYRPLKAESLYKTGYSLIAQDLYAGSEEKFNEALTYKVKKRWFFKYARAYREKRRYERAAVMYEQLVKRFKFDKQGALEYALMEFEDLADYRRAAEIVRRLVLDYHINDKDAMLLLGDIYLEWAGVAETGKAEKFEEARLQYSTLMDLYGSTDLYLARMLRYFIRTDNLREVLPLKGYFTSAKKVMLPAQDLIELGGYLLEKQYAYLPPSDEYLRACIDNVKRLLEQGIKADPSIPEGHYNLSRYFVRKGNSEQATLALSNALSTFAAAKKQTHGRTLKHIDTYRLLGECYSADQEYLLAEEQFSSGISLFEQKKQYTGLKSDKNVGKLYGDMADIDYFISGDIKNALRNYKLAIENGYDTPSVRYRIGFVQYTEANYSEALGSFIKTASEDSSNRNLLLALGNVLSIRGDEAAARGCYERLIHILDADRQRLGILFPQVNEEQYALVDLYLKASNNLGVTLSRMAVQTGNSSLQAQAIVHFSESVRAWDALTRNQKTMVRLEGSNLAAQNIKYVTYPQRFFEPSIYASIPAVLYGEVGLKQYSLE